MRYCKVLMIFVVLFSCGPKKGIVTKKGKQNEKIEQPVVVSDDKRVSEIENEVLTEDVGPKTFKSATDEYIYRFRGIAVGEMRLYKIPASITLAQGILESGSGRGRLAIEANNHFGIKCHDWKGERIYHDDDRSQECFRKYSHPKFSFRDHSEFLSLRSRYADLFKLRTNDYKAWAKGLRAAGYATDRQYPEKLINLIERYELYKYDELVLKGSGLDGIPNENTGNEVASTTVNHVVQKGDTLYSLSKRYDISIDEIKRINGLSGTGLSIGQILKIKIN